MLGNLFGPKKPADQPVPAPPLAGMAPGQVSPGAYPPPAPYQAAPQQPVAPMPAPGPYGPAPVTPTPDMAQAPQEAVPAAPTAAASAIPAAPVSAGADLGGSKMDPALRQNLSALSHLDTRTTQILQNAHKEAVRTKQQHIEPEQILLGLLYDEGIFQLFDQFSVDVAKISRDLQQKEVPQNATGQPTLSNDSVQIFEQAYRGAKGRGVGFVEPIDVLLSIYTVNKKLADYLKAEGVSKEQLEEKLQKSGEFSAGKKTTMEKYGVDLTAEAAQGKLDPVVGRDKEVERLIHILLRRTKNNPIIIGEAGVGKTAIIEGLAQQIVSGQVPSDLAKKRIIQLDVSSLVAGASHRGEFEERLREVIKDAMASAGQIVLFIDEIHTLIGAGGDGGAMDASNIIKPHLARGHLQLIGTTTTAEYRKYFEKDKAFERRFQPIIAEEPDEETAIKMLQVLRPKFENFHHVVITDEAIEAAVKLSKKYIGERYLPDKAVDLLDEASSEVKLALARGKGMDTVAGDTTEKEGEGEQKTETKAGEEKSPEGTDGTMITADTKGNTAQTAAPATTPPLPTDPNSAVNSATTPPPAINPTAVGNAGMNSPVSMSPGGPVAAGQSTAPATTPSQPMVGAAGGIATAQPPGTMDPANPAQSPTPGTPPTDPAASPGGQVPSGPPALQMPGEQPAQPVQDPPAGTQPGTPGTTDQKTPDGANPAEAAGGAAVTKLEDAAEYNKPGEGKDVERTGSGASNEVHRQDIEKVVSSWTGIPITKLTEDEGKKLLELEKRIHQRLIDQEEAVLAVSEAVRRGRIGLASGARPIASFIFLGPSGTGKTELAKTLSEILFGRDDAIIRLDMSEYMEKHEVAKLIGAPPGYVGYEEGGQLTEAVRAKPYSIVLLDEVEKAHPDVFNILLQLLEDGRLTDNKGNTISFKNTIVICTSNIGSQLIVQKLGEKDKNIQRTQEQEKKDFAELSGQVNEELRKFFRPELLNRFDDIVIFKPLRRQDMKGIAKLGIKKTAKLLKEQGYGVQITDKALEQLAKEGYDPIYGARPLRRLIQSSVENPIALQIIGKSFAAGDGILIDYDQEKNEFKFTKSDQTVAGLADEKDGKDAKDGKVATAKDGEKDSASQPSDPNTPTNPNLPTDPNAGGNSGANPQWPLNIPSTDPNAPQPIQPGTPGGTAAAMPGQPAVNAANAPAGVEALLGNAQAAPVEKPFDPLALVSSDSMEENKKDPAVGSNPEPTPPSPPSGGAGATNGSAAAGSTAN